MEKLGRILPLPTTELPLLTDYKYCHHSFPILLSNLLHTINDMEGAHSRCPCVLVRHNNGRCLSILRCLSGLVRTHIRRTLEKLLDVEKGELRSERCRYDDNERERVCSHIH